PLAAQGGQGVVAGTVVAEGTMRPLPNAQVAVAGTQLGTTTDVQGQFRLTGVSGDRVQLTVRLIGYRPADQEVEVGRTDLRIVMSERAIELNEVVVTGTAGATEKRAIGNAVTTVDVAAVTATQPVRSFQDLVTGRASGVSVVGSSGQVGSGSRIRVRGASSLSLANDPLIYVDGIRVDNAQATGPLNQGFGSRAVSRWNDFNPEDIESIEVIKGPAAATLYGTEASNGVIQIITKRGAAGTPRWNFTARVGANFIPDFENAFYTNYGAVPNAAGGLDTVTITVAQLNDSVQAHFGHDIFRTGLLQDYQLNVSGGTPAFRYYVGGNYEESEGVEYDNSLRRAGLRANLSVSPGSKWDLQSSMAYTTGRTYMPLESGGGGGTWATYFSSPGFLYTAGEDPDDATDDQPGNPQLGFRSGPPDIYYRVMNIYQDADRFTGSVTVTHRPASWFDHRLIVGIDRAIEDNQEQAPRNDILGTEYSSFSYVGPDSRGYVDVWTRNSSNTTLDYVANGKFQLTPAWRSVTSVGGQFYGRRVNNRELYGEGFPAGGLTAVVAAEIQQFGEDEVFENNTVGGFIQEQVIWNDRLFLTGAVRTDDNSAFGTNFNAVTYPKFSASYVLSEEPSLSLPDQVSTLRLRAAYGASGLQPGAFDAIRTYTPTGGQVTPLSPGNPDLGPERSTELELGFDAGLFDERLGAEFTYFDGTTKDAILSRLAPPSEGFQGLQFFNAGQVDRRGFEWVVRGQPVSNETLALDLTLSGSTNKYEIKSLGEGTERVSLSSQIQHVVGYAPGAWWDRRVVSATKNVLPDGSVEITDLMCDDGQGGSVACDGAPRVFLGNSVPTYEGSFSAGLTFLRDFRLNAFFDWRGGYKKLDGNRRVRCNLFDLCEENYYPSRDKFDAVTLAEVENGTAFTYNLIKDASFTRFRELSLTYTLPARFTAPLGASRASITLAGRNLALWTDYPGLEPEASFNGGSRGGAFGQWEQNVLPQLREFVATFNVSF
ncbi:MAG TPA: SusC/RagA family TonB-linked outer membrane protein, partial [Gemmatimonadaceae bacterium]|nr:SusC/RagA family TonB-linked outer membrane protein [Gemmatimonadaceae bacterium]